MNIHSLHNEIKLDLVETGVYTIESLLHPDKYYVGSASRSGSKTRSQNGFWKRWQEHYWDLFHNKHPCKHLQNIVNKYGIEVIRFKILETYPPKMCESMEQYWINQLNVYNTCKVAGSSLGIKRSEAYKQAVSDRMKGANNPNYRNKLGTLSRHGSVYNRKKILITNIKTQESVLLNSLRETAKYLGCHVTNISYALNTPNALCMKKTYSITLVVERINN